MPVTIKERVAENLLCETNLEYRALAYARCRRDPVYWLNNFGWTFDPRLEGDAQYQPFILYPIQEEYMRFGIRHIRIGESFGVEKSRDMGCTWLTLALLVHQWIFEPMFTANVGSMTEDKVCKTDDKDTLYWKMEFLVVNLPNWMIPHGFDRRKNIAFMRMTNPANGATITGAAPTQNFGRSGRAKAMLFDELQAWEEAEPAWNSAASTAPCRIAVGTPNGMNFYGKMMNPREGVPALPKFIIDWRDDPRKNEWIAFDLKPGTSDISSTGELSEEFLSRARVVGRGTGWAKDPPKRTKWLYYPWYIHQEYKVFFGDKEWMAQEIDRDYKRSVRGRVYTNFPLARIGRYFYQDGKYTFSMWDVGDDMTAIGWLQYDNATRRISLVDYIQKPGKLIEWFVPFFTGRVPSGGDDEYTEAEKEKIRSHDGWRVDEHYGDPSGKATNQVTDYSAYDVLETYGIEIQTNDYARSFATRISTAKRLLPRLNIDEVNCRDFIEAMENYKWPDRGDNHNSTTTALKPVHNKHSHGPTAWEYFAVNFPWSDLDNVDPLSENPRDAIERNLRMYEDEVVAGARGVTGYGD